MVLNAAYNIHNDLSYFLCEVRGQVLRSSKQTPTITLIKDPRLILNEVFKHKIKHRDLVKDECQPWVGDRVSKSVCTVEKTDHA